MTELTDRVQALKDFEKASDAAAKKKVEEELAILEKQKEAVRQIASLQAGQGRAARGGGGFARPRKGPSRVGRVTAPPTAKAKRAIGKSSRPRKTGAKVKPVVPKRKRTASTKKTPPKKKAKK